MSLLLGYWDGSPLLRRTEALRSIVGRWDVEGGPRNNLIRSWAKNVYDSMAELNRHWLGVSGNGVADVTKEVDDVGLAVAERLEELNDRLSRLTVTPSDDLFFSGEIVSDRSLTQQPPDTLS